MKRVDDCFFHLPLPLSMLFTNRTILRKKKQFHNNLFKCYESDFSVITYDVGALFWKVYITYLHKLSSARNPYQPIGWQQILFDFCARSEKISDTTFLHH